MIVLVALQMIDTVGVAVAHMFFPVHAHMCSTEASCSLMGPRRLIYPILSCLAQEKQQKQ